MKSPALLALVATGCISVPPEQGAMCKQTSDCSGGEVCQEGVCWGDPPPGTFAAVLVPSGDRTDLVPTEIPSLMIPQDGWLDHVPFAPPVTVAGRVEAYCPPGANTCTNASLGATITITRRSEFQGGPGFAALVTSKPGVARGADSFSVLVPPGGPSDGPFTVTVTPDGGGPKPPSDGTSAAMLAPPLRTTLPATGGATSTTFVLGSANTLGVDGSLGDGIRALTKYRVVARGQWDASSPLAEVSSVAYSTDGTFHLAIADGVTGPLEIVAQPYDDTVVAPTLRLGGVQPGATQVALVQPAGLGNPLAVTIPVIGVGANGAVGPVAGAHVIVTGSYNPMFGGTRADLTVASDTDNAGNAHVVVLDGSALRSSYQLSIVPPPGSSLGVLYAVPLVLDTAATGSVTIDAQRLPSRIALRGVAVDSAGHPLANLSVTASPSLRFRWSLDAAGQAFLANLPAATAVTSQTGDFVLSVDPFVDNVWAHYDITFDPPAGGPAPSWTLPEAEIPPGQTHADVSLSTVTIPDASHVHGELVDPSGAPVPGADLQIFEGMTDQSLCAQVPHPPADCVIPARRLGVGSADETGIVRLTLPHP